MRLMLGTKDQPRLLVNVQRKHDRLAHFEFWVVNGAWHGSFYNGHVTVWNPPSGSWTDLDKIDILCNNQDRLRGEYHDVFYNFDNVDYVAPSPQKFVQPAGWDDDIAF